MLDPVDEVRLQPRFWEPLASDAPLYWELMTAAPAEQKAWGVPGTTHGYHARIFGYVVGEVVGRGAQDELRAINEAKKFVK